RRSATGRARGRARRSRARARASPPRPRARAPAIRGSPRPRARWWWPRPSRPHRRRTRRGRAPPRSRDPPHTRSLRSGPILSMPPRLPCRSAHTVLTRSLPYAPVVRLLVVEDEPRMSTLLARGFREEGHAVDVAMDGTDGLWRATETEYDAIVLDVML